MIQIPLFAQARFSAVFAIARSAVCLSRILLLVVAIEVITMPFTQGIWSWDKFLHGGQDFEFGLLLIVTCLCLVLLRVQQNRSCFGWLALIHDVLLRIRSPFAPCLSQRPTRFRHRSRIPLPLVPKALSLPLLI